MKEILPDHLGFSRCSRRLGGMGEKDREGTQDGEEASPG